MGLGLGAAALCGQKALKVVWLRGPCGGPELPVAGTCITGHPGCGAGCLASTRDMESLCASPTLLHTDSLGRKVLVGLDLGGIPSAWGRH